MRRLLGWIGGAAGGITAYRLLRRRPSPDPVAAEPHTRAEELRAKLAESRAAEPAVQEPAVQEPAAQEPAAEPEPVEEPESPEDRRRRVHEEGRATLDEMKSE
ncbi:MAG TPA: hypothetical protein VE985_05050 [Gaiellaceae bacterium]|nr:hypothetical protein [Gaiellaceae bacterium]